MLIGSFRHLDIRCDEMEIVLYARYKLYCGAFVPSLHVHTSTFGMIFSLGVKTKGKEYRPNTTTSAATGFRFVFSFVKVGKVSCIAVVSVLAARSILSQLF